MAKGNSLGAEGPNSIFSSPGIASFVECAITSSLTSQESRVFGAAWAAVAAGRQGSADSLLKLAPSPSSAKQMWESLGLKPNTMDVGWLLGCFAMAVAKEYDVGDSGAPLIAWEKYRTIWNLVEASALGQQQASQFDVDSASKRLKIMQDALVSVRWDQKIFKEEAAREANALAASPTSRQLRPVKAMAALIAEQTERQNRLRQIAEVLEASKRAQAETAHIAQMRRNHVAPTATPSAAEKRSRRVTSLFKGGLRPLAGNSLDVAQPASRPAVDLLNLIPASKASLVVRCGMSTVSIWANSQRSYTFHLTTPDGGKHLLQATSQGEMAEWTRAIETAAKAFRPAQGTIKGTASSGSLKAGEYTPSSVASYLTDTMTPTQCPFSVCRCKPSSNEKAAWSRS